MAEYATLLIFTVSKLHLGISFDSGDEEVSGYMEGKKRKEQKVM
jgi:hypothetical protein